VPVYIQSVQKNSPAQKAGLRAGMLLCRLDGHEINDGLDYEFYSSAAELDAVVEQDDGGELVFQVKKGDFEPLGCDFETYLIDKQHRCRNNCIFCFVDQLPKDMRSTLYFKDDDERLSFLFGNYITLTNLTEKEAQRIIDMRIPVNISVHTANPELRVEMMRNKHAGEVLSYIPRFAEAGITMNTQLVLCPGLNDGAELRRSIEWLAQHRPAVHSLAAVPVGLTRHRQNCYKLTAYTQRQAAEQLDIMLEYGDGFVKEGGERFVYPSDEWFLLAGRSLPETLFYDEYHQLENGVGMWRLFYDEFIDGLAYTKKAPSATADVVTGTLAAPLLRQLADALRERFPQVKMNVHAVQNDYFGHGVTVAGLLTGEDVMKQLKGRLESGVLLLPQAMLCANGEVMLDDMTLEDLQRALGVQVQAVPQDGAALLQAVLAVSK
jgi:putative radical SAM enzyme (TIGR03279 family)